jgi:cysteinyl-tRNA synthetase
MLEFSFEALEESATAFRRIENFLIRVREIEGEIEQVIAPEFKAAMDEDLAVPQALAYISEWLRAGNTAINEAKSALAEAKKIRGALGILGCDPFDLAFGESGNKKLDKAVDGLIALLLEQREAARVRKDFAAADAIRDRIASMGITIEDTSNGPRWSVE